MVFRPRPAPETPETASAMMPRGSTSRSASERREREADRGRIAARAPRRARAPASVVAVQLDHPVREATDQLGRGVRFAVPALVRVGRQPEVGAEVDDVRDAFEDLGDQQLRRAVRQRGEHEVEAAQVGDVVGREPEVAVRRDAATDRASADRRARVRVGGDVHDLDLGCPASSRSSSAPVYPDPPTTAARYAMAHTIQSRCIAGPSRFADLAAGHAARAVPGHGLGGRQRALLAHRRAPTTRRSERARCIPPIAANLTVLTFQQTLPRGDDPDPAAPRVPPARPGRHGARQRSATVTARYDKRGRDVRRRRR